MAESFPIPKSRGGLDPLTASRLGERCPNCSSTELGVRRRPDTPHWGELICGYCAHHFYWLPKPESEKTKRPASHRDLVHKYSDGFCELCLLRPEQLPPGQTLEAHHIIEVQDGGSADRENIWIVCTKCARLIHWMRTHAGRSNPRPFWHRPPEA